MAAKNDPQFAPTDVGSSVYGKHRSAILSPAPVPNLHQVRLPSTQSHPAKSTPPPGPRNLRCRRRSHLLETTPSSKPDRQTIQGSHGRRQGGKKHTTVGIGGARKIREVSAASAGEAVARGLLRQRMREVRVGCVLRGARGVQQALQERFRSQTKALLILKTTK